MALISRSRSSSYHFLPIAHLSSGIIANRLSRVAGLQVDGGRPVSGARHSENIRCAANAYGGLSERARRRALEITDDSDLRLAAPVQRHKQPAASDPVNEKRDIGLRCYLGARLICTLC
jgi:hypothetical protein